MLTFPAMHFASSGSSNGNDSFTKLLLNCDGADASTTFTDASSVGHAVTANGNAQVDTAQSKFGTGSFLSDGSGDYLNVPDHDDLDMDDDFTVDFWFRAASISGGFQTFVSKRVGTSFSVPYLITLNGSNVQLYASTNGTAYNASNGTSFGTASATTWHHVAFCREGDEWYLFLDGVLGNNFTHSGYATNAQDVQIGSQNSGSFTFDGHMDEIRISKGIARWTSAFTPPTVAYS